MNFTMKIPCDECPFSRGPSAIRIDKNRAKEISAMMLDSQGGTFPCHKSVEWDDEGEHVQRSQDTHCAGALIFAEKNQNATQMMRICERIGSYNAAELMRDKEAVDLVFDTQAEMVAAHGQKPVKPTKAALAMLSKKLRKVAIK